MTILESIFAGVIALALSVGYFIYQEKQPPADDRYQITILGYFKVVGLFFVHLLSFMIVGMILSAVFTALGVTNVYFAVFTIVAFIVGWLLFLWLPHYRKIFNNNKELK